MPGDFGEFMVNIGLGTPFWNSYDTLSYVYINGTVNILIKPLNINCMVLIALIISLNLTGLPSIIKFIPPGNNLSINNDHKSDLFSFAISFINHIITIL